MGQCGTNSLNPTFPTAARVITSDYTLTSLLSLPFLKEMVESFTIFLFVLGETYGSSYS